MPITVNENGVLYELSEVYTNESGVLHELDTIHSNEGGVLHEIHSALRLPDITWHISGASDPITPATISVDNNGRTLVATNLYTHGTVTSSKFVLHGYSNIRINTVAYTDSSNSLAEFNIMIYKHDNVMKTLYPKSSSTSGTSSSNDVYIDTLTDNYVIIVNGSNAHAYKLVLNLEFVK